MPSWFNFERSGFIFDTSSRAVTSESGVGLSFGLEFIFYWTRNWPGMEGTGIGIGPEWAVTGLGLGADSSLVHKRRG